MVAKDLAWATVVLTRRTKITCQSEERSGRSEVADKVDKNNNNIKNNNKTSQTTALNINA